MTRTSFRVLGVWSTVVLSLLWSPIPVSGQDRIRLLYSEDIYSLTSVVAQEQGFFVREGLLVNAQPLPYGGLALQALAGGQADFAVAANARFLGAVLSDLPIVTVGITCYGYQGELIVRASDTHVRTLRDLVGKRIAVQMGSGASAVFLRYMDHLGLKPSDFRIAEINTPQIPAALESGAVDAGFLWRPYSTQMVHRGLARVVIPPNVIAEAVGSTYAFPVMTHRRLVEQRPDVVQRFANAWVRAMDWLVRHPEQAVEVLRDALILQAGISLPEPVIREYLSGVRFDRSTFTSDDIRDTLASADAFAKFGIQRQTASFEQLAARVNNTFMETAERNYRSR